ncbi:MAG: hypothetical protein ACU0CB_03260 [Roseovarius sp.]
MGKNWQAIEAFQIVLWVTGYERGRATVPNMAFCVRSMLNVNATIAVNVGDGNSGGLCVRNTVIEFQRVRKCSGEKRHYGYSGCSRTNPHAPDSMQSSEHVSKSFTPLAIRLDSLPQLDLDLSQS